MTTLPAVVTILDLTSAATLSSSAFLEAVQTTNGVAESVKIAVSQIATTGFGNLPVGGGTGQFLTKSSGSNFDTAWSNIASSIVGTTGGGIAVSGSTIASLFLATTAGLSVLGVAAAASAIPSPIVASASAQVLQSNAGGTGILFGPLSTTLLPGPFQTSTLTQFGSLYGNGTAVIGATAPGTTAWPLVGNGTAAAPSFQVLTVPGGGTNTTTLTAFGVTYGNGTSTIGITAAGTALWPLLGNGTALAPSFQLLNLSSSVTGILRTPNGGLGTGSFTAFGALYGNGTSTIGVTTAGTTGWPLLGNGTSVAPGFALLNLTAGVTGILTVPNAGIGTGALLPFAVLCGGTTATGAINNVAVATAGFVLTANGTAALPSFQAGAGSVPVQTIFTTGSGNYTTTAGARYIEVIIIGGGGGGGGGNNGTPGSAGATTTFGTSLMTAGPGLAGSNANGRGGAGGTALGGDINIAGAYGGPTQQGITGGAGAGSPGGATPFGGAGAGSFNTSGSPADASPATPNTGSGGGGGGVVGAVAAGSGGGAGGYVSKLIAVPLATYSYVVGAGGSPAAAGSSGTMGGTGAAGIIIIKAFS